MKKINKGGRPTKLESQKRKYPLNLKLTTTENLTLKAKVKIAGITRSEYVRQAIIKGTIKQRITPEILDFIRKLCGMANNLNQVARKANAAGYSDTRIEYLYLADKIDNLLNEMRK